MQTTGEKKPGENSEAEITKGVKEMSAVLVCWRSSNWRSWNNSYCNKLRFCCTLFKKRWSIAHDATAAGFLRLNEATPSRTGHSVTPLQWYSFILKENYEGFAKRSIVTEVFTEQHTNAFQTLDGWACTAQFILKVDEFWDIKWQKAVLGLGVQLNFPHISNKIPQIVSDVFVFQYKSFSSSASSSYPVALVCEISHQNNAISLLDLTSIRAAVLPH